MNEFKRAREEYESTPIPEELDARVRAGIRQGRTSSRSRGYKVCLLYTSPSPRD